MDIEIDFTEDIQRYIEDQIEFVKEEFDVLFGTRKKFTRMDREIAMQLLNYLTKVIDQPICLDKLSQTLESLEKKYPLLFVL